MSHLSTWRDDLPCTATSDDGPCVFKRAANDWDGHDHTTIEQLQAKLNPGYFIIPPQPTEPNNKEADDGQAEAEPGTV